MLKCSPAFEIQGREKFEPPIEARTAGFYSSQGGAEHIEDYLSGFAGGAVVLYLYTLSLNY